MEKSVELLAPAGSYEAFLGAVNAGADAVYLGGERFGARAYAQNFTAAEVCRAIRTAHFMGRKIYLTVNTLLKEVEFTELETYLRPFYEAGLDGLIVQDFGVLRYIGEHFPELALHASTQMAVTGSGGAALLGGLGVERIVPARELSLDEVKRMKEETGLEIECFIHGAMCYCYSGQCLFSSILGGRSGNRGRCAQPCRLPYQILDGEEKITDADYPLSLKDMCMISYLPQLIEAGIDSFKIEGRMKKPEYAAGVTALYRKYIDLYMRNGAAGYCVAKEDMDMLRSLYIRSEIQTGYYERHNGREMITLHKPSYAGSDPTLLEHISSEYIREPVKQPVKMTVTLAVGVPVCLQIVGSAPANTAHKGDISNKDGTKTELSVTVYGSMAEAARKMPLQPADIKKQMMKTGNCNLTVTACEIVMRDDVFLPVSALNALRRKGVEAYEREYIHRQGLSAGRHSLADTECVYDKLQDNPSIECMGAASDEVCGKNTEADVPGEAAVDILVSTCEQLAVAVAFPCRRIYIDSDLYVKDHETVVSHMLAHDDRQYALALPYILRMRDKAYLQNLTDLVKLDCGCRKTGLPDGSSLQNSGTMISGFLVRNLEGLSYAQSFGDSYELIPDAGLYTFNKESLCFWTDYSRECTLPYELNRKETGRLARAAREIGLCTVMIVYGTIPLMVTANCVRKTAGRCPADVHDRPYSELRIRDRYGTDFPVETNCLHCYNIIYNSVPYSLHLQENEVKRIGADIRRYDFITESAKDCRRILAGEPFPYEAYTTGHLKRGVE